MVFVDTALYVVEDPFQELAQTVLASFFVPTVLHHCLLRRADTDLEQILRCMGLLARRKAAALVAGEAAHLQEGDLLQEEQEVVVLRQEYLDQTDQVLH